MRTLQAPLCRVVPTCGAGFSLGSRLSGPPSCEASLLGSAVSHRPLYLLFAHVSLLTDSGSLRRHCSAAPGMAITRVAIKCIVEPVIIPGQEYRRGGSVVW